MALRAPRDVTWTGAHTPTMVMRIPWDHETMALWVMGVILVMAVTFLNHSAYALGLVLTGAHGLCGVARMGHNEHVEWALHKVTDATTPCPINHRVLGLGPMGLLEPWRRL